MTGITSLGLDHTALLGNTIEEIAWNKAGIFKEGAAALTVEQKPEAMAVLKSRAEEAKVSLASQSNDATYVVLISLRFVGLSIVVCFLFYRSHPPRAQDLQAW